MEEPNLEYVDLLAAGDAGFRANFLEILKRELPREAELYAEAIAGRDWQEAMQWVHKIKHKIGVLSLQQGYGLAQKHEENLRQGNAELHPDFENLLDSMQTFLNSTPV